MLPETKVQAEWFESLDITNPTKHDQSLHATFQLSWQEVKDETTRKVFGLAAQFPQKMPLSTEIFRKALDIDDKTIAKSVYRLRMLNLLMSSEDLVVIHPLLAKYAKLVVRSGLLPLLLDGSISAPIVRIAGSSVPKMEIRNDQAWQIDVNWEVHGALLKQQTPASFPFTGDWIVRAYLESIGLGEEYTLPDNDGVKINMNASKTEELNKDIKTYDRWDYTATITIEAGKVVAGVYKLVVAITHETTQGVPGPFAGFFEGGVLQIYNLKQKYSSE